MVFQKDVAIYLDLFVVLPPDQGIEEDLYGAGAGENG